MVTRTSPELVPMPVTVPDLPRGPEWPYGRPMFDVLCPTHGTRVLLGPRSIDRIEATERGLEVHWTCRCGTSGVLLTGLTARPRPEVRAAA